MEGNSQSYPSCSIKRQNIRGKNSVGAVKISFIIFTQELRAGGSQSGLGKYLDSVIR